MDRIIEVKVFGSHLTKDSKNAGTRGEANITKLRITFDEGWKDYDKKVVFWDAYGENAVRIILTENLLEDGTKSKLIYLVPIPAEAMARAGMMSFEIIGSLDDKKQASITSELEVKDSKLVLEPEPPTPDELSQIQQQFEKTMDKLQETIKAKEAIENMSVFAEGLGEDDAAIVEKTTNEDGSINLKFGIPAGKKPKAGVDYWTDDEKQAIANFVAERVGDTEEAVALILEIQEALINGDTDLNLLSVFAKIDLSNVPDETLRARIENLMAAVISATENHTHSASEIGASPIGHTHTAEEVGAASVNHTHTASEVGASPVGHKHSASDISSGTLSTDRLPTIPLTKGGTGATDSATARTNLGIKSETWTFTLEDGSTTTKKVLVL